MTDKTVHKLAIKGNPKESKYRVALELIKKHQIIAVSGETTSIIFIYDNGIYIKGEDFLRSEIQKIYEEEATTATKNEVINKIKDLTFIRFEDIQRDNYDLLPMADGVFNIKERSIIDYKPEYYFFTKIPVTYDPSAECPLHMNFFQEVLEEEDIPLIQEILGYALYRRMFLKKAFLFVGIKNTGKSTILKIFKNLIGIKNIAGVSLQKLSGDKFAIANLYQKYLNVYDDLDAQGINNHGAFKIATGGGLVSGEKKFGDEFQFINYAKSIFACNDIPDVKEVHDDAYFDRWVMINFNKKIEKIDVFLDEKLKDDKELSGLFNFALVGLQRLLANHKFSNNKTSEDTKMSMLKNSNSISSFVQDCVAEDTEAPFVINAEIYEAYQLYCKDFNLALQGDTKFHRDIPTYCPYLIKTTSIQNVHAKQMRGYSNIIIKMKI